MAVWSIVSSSKMNSDLRFEAEYFQPKYLDLENRLSALDCNRIKDVSTSIRSGPFGSNLLKINYVEDGIIVLRPFNIKDATVENDNLVYISEEECKKNKLKQYKAGDLVFARVGDIRCGVIPDYGQHVTISPNIIAVQVDREKMNPYFLSIFMNTKLGLLQMERNIKVVAQPTITVETIKSILVPKISINEQNIIAGMFERSLQKRLESEALYFDAESLLLRELGLDSLDLSPQIAHTANFSEAMEARRLDAEYFQPKFWKIINTIQNKVQWCRLNDIVIYCQRGIQPKYVEEGTINVVNTKHMTSTILSDDLEKTDEEFWINNKNAQLHKNDVLLYSTGAYIGRTNFYPCYEKAIGSNHVTIIRVDPKKCNPLFVSIYLNTIPGLFQTDQRARGSAQREIYPDDIRTFVIGLPKREIQDQIGGKVQQSFETRQMAKTLLEDAKNRVEQTILGEK